MTMSFRYRHRPRYQAVEESCPLQEMRQHRASFLTSATTAVVSVLRICLADGGAFVCHRPSIHHRLTIVAFSLRRYGCACALAASFGGWHRFSASSTAVVHTPLCSDSLLPSSLPITHAQGTGNEETPQELIGTLPLSFAGISVKHLCLLKYVMLVKEKNMSATTRYLQAFSDTA